MNKQHHPETQQTGTAPCSPIIIEAHRGGVEIVNRLANEWRELCITGSQNQPFFRPEWIAAVLSAFESKDNFLLITARSNERLHAVLPLIQERRSFCGLPIRQLRGAANWHSGRFDLIRICGPDGDAAVRAMWNFLRDLPGWDWMEFPDVPEFGAAELLLKAAELDAFLTGSWQSMQCPYFMIPHAEPAGGPVYPPGVSGRFRKDLRRVTRKLEAQGTLKLHRLEAADREYLEHFYKMEASGWKGEHGSAILSNLEKRRFYDEIAQVAAQFGYLSMYFLELNGCPIAGHLGLTLESEYYSLKVAYDEKYAIHSPGHLLVEAVVGDCAQRGVKEFDFTGALDGWKAKWTSSSRSHSYCYIFRKNPYGRLLYLIKFWLIPRLKKHLDGGRSKKSKTNIHSADDEGKHST